MRRAGAEPSERLVLTLCCCPAGQVYASLRTGRWRARSWSWTAGAATLLDEAYASLRTARWRALRLRVLLSYWTRPTPPFAQPGGMRAAESGRLVLLPYWTTPSFAPPSGMSRAKVGPLVLLP